jgi:aminoglycoside phosphotransferase (APT) family kinase protein
MMTIAADWVEPVRVALRQTFGIDEPDEVVTVSGGLSGASVLRVTIGKRRYLLRLDPPVEGFGDPRRWHRCMRIAAEAGVAPTVHYADPGGVSIVDFVEQDPSAPYWSGDRNLLRTRLGELLRRLHAAPAFPPLLDYLDGMDAVIGNVAAAGLMSEQELAVPLAKFAALADVYRALSPQLVPSHNDVNPRNVVYDGQRLWLVDWTAAFQSDRFTDLASIASFMAQDEEGEALLLAAYFGTPATEAQRARMYLARQINHMFYAMSLIGTAGGARPVRVRALAEMHAALRAGEAVMDTAIGRAEYAHARLAAMVAGVDAPRFDEARRLAT